LLHFNLKMWDFYPRTLDIRPDGRGQVRAVNSLRRRGSHALYRRIELCEAELAILAGPRSRHGWNNRSCRGSRWRQCSLALAQADQSFFAIGQIHKSDKQMIATEYPKPNQVVEVSSK
jgi:hypothetical protein